MFFKFLFSMILSFVLVSAVNAGQGEAHFRLARKSAREHDYDFAFMQYRALLRESPGSVHREKALFGIGEYYYEVSRDPVLAKEMFVRLLDDFPESKARLFALAYLLKISEDRNDEESRQHWIRMMVDIRQERFVFKDRKEVFFQSGLEHRLKAVVLIDQIQFFIDEQHFVTATF